MKEIIIIFKNERLSDFYGSNVNALITMTSGLWISDQSVSESFRSYSSFQDLAYSPSSSQSSSSELERPRYATTLLSASLNSVTKNLWTSVRRLSTWTLYTRIRNEFFTTVQVKTRGFVFEISELRIDRLFGSRWLLNSCLSFRWLSEWVSVKWETCDRRPRHGHAWTIQSVHLGQVLHGAAEVLGDGEEIARWGSRAQNWKIV